MELFTDNDVYGGYLEIVRWNTLFRVVRKCMREELCGGLQLKTRK